jgi:outer membrane protein TolC
MRLLLVFSASQRNYLRAAKYAVQSSQSALTNTRIQVEEDTVIAYLSLQEALGRQSAITDEYHAAVNLRSVVEERFSAGLESQIEMKDACRTEVQVRLQKLQLEDEVASLRDHLERMTGIPSDQFALVPVVLPSVPLSHPVSPPSPSTETGIPKVLAASANARSKLQQAFGDSRDTWMPQVSFNAQYGRISPFNNVSSYYNLNGDYNTLAVGVQIQIPLLDLSRKAKARESMADAMHAEHELENLRDQAGEDHIKSEHGAVELAAKAELAEIDHGLAQDRLNAIIVEENATAAGNTVPIVTPKEEQKARIQERLKYLDLLDANLEVMKVKVDILKRSGDLENWIASCHSEH